MSIEIILTVAFALQPGELQVDYWVENRSSQSIYLTNHAVRMLPKQGPVPDRQYAFVWIDGTAVHIAKRKPSPPADRFFTPRPHYVTPVAAGQTYTESFNLPLPLRESIPYRESQSGKAGQARSVDLTIGYIPASPTIEAVALRIAGQDVYGLRPNKANIMRQGLKVGSIEEALLRSPPQSLSIPVVYSD